MTNYTYSLNQRSDYENFYARCPHCEFDNIFNRVSDLGITDPIAFMTVQCQNNKCRTNFSINNDTVNAVHETILYDCHELIKIKKYSSCVINICQAYEYFFSLVAHVQLLYKPFDKEIDSITDLNNATTRLQSVIKDYPYQKMRNVFLHLIINDIKPKSLKESIFAIDLISNKDIANKTPSNEEINRISDIALRLTVKTVRDSRISTLRNNVAHKMVYRPSLDEVSSLLSEAKHCIFKTSAAMNIVGDDINFYCL